MATKFLDLTFTDSVREAQEHYYGKSRRIEARSRTTSSQMMRQRFIQSRDSFYMATINESGWPYIQHRGGKPGFLRVIGPSTLAFADYKGNRQLLSTGNLAVNRPRGVVPDGLSAAHAAEDSRSRPRRGRERASRACRANRRTRCPAPRRTIVFHRSGIFRLELSSIHYAALHRRRNPGASRQAPTTHRGTRGAIENWHQSVRDQ